MKDYFKIQLENTTALPVEHIDERIARRKETGHPFDEEKLRSLVLTETELEWNQIKSRIGK